MTQLKLNCETHPLVICNENNLVHHKKLNQKYNFIKKVAQRPDLGLFFIKQSFKVINFHFHI